MSQFLSLFQEDVLVRLREMGMEQVCRALRASVASELYLQSDEQMHHMFRWVFADSKISIGYVEGASYIQKILQTLNRKFLVAHAMLRSSAFQLQPYFQAFIILEE